MKKLWLFSLLLLTTSINLIGAAVPGANIPAAVQAVNYIPAPGRLQLGDTVNAQGQVTVYGTIMDELVNNQTDQKIVQALADIRAFTNNQQRSYQTIMSNLQTLPRAQQDRDEAIAAIRAIETTIMNLYDQRAYLLGSYRRGQSIFFTGIRKNLSHPTINAELDQLIQELHNLAKIAAVHSSVMSNRIWATAHSYRHWRRNLMVSTIAYLSFDVANQGLQNSTVHKLYYGGISTAPGIMYNAGSNLFTSAKIITKAIFGGAKAFAQQENKKTNNIVPKKPVTVIDTIKQDPKPANNVAKQPHVTAYLIDAWYDFLTKFNTPDTQKASPCPVVNLPAQPMVKLSEKSTWSESIVKPFRWIKENVKIGEKGQVYSE